MTTTTTTSNDELNWCHTPDTPRFHEEHQPPNEDRITWEWCEPGPYGGTVDGGWRGKTGSERLATALEPAPTGEQRYDVAFTHGEWSEQHTSSETPRTVPEMDKTQRYESRVFELSATDSATCWWNTTHHQATTWSHQSECSPAGPLTIVAHSVLVSNVYHFYSPGPPSPTIVTYRRSVLEVELTTANDDIRHEYGPERPLSPQRLDGEGCDTTVGLWDSGR